VDLIVNIDGFVLAISLFSTWPDGNVPSSQLIEHRGIANAACPHVVSSGQLSQISLRLHNQSVVIHSFIHYLN
jgi:hypothetical protein